MHSPLPDFFVLFSLSILIKNPASTEMLRWLWNENTPFSQVAGTLKTPFLHTSTYLTALAFVVTGNQTWVRINLYLLIGPGILAQLTVGRKGVHLS